MEESTMGLDMWLVAKKEEDQPEVGYWRKANQIREFFASHIPEKRSENIEELVVNSEMLADLKSKILACLSDRSPETSENLLPTAGGFFFGSTVYDEMYYQDLEETLPIIERAEELLSDGYQVSYTEWW